MANIVVRWCGFNRDFLRDHHVETVSDLLAKGKELIERYFSLWEPDIDKILRQHRKYEKKRQCSSFYRPGERSYRKMVKECSTAEVLNELSKRLNHLSPYETKEKCFRRIPSPRIECAPFKSESTISIFLPPQHTLSHGNSNGKGVKYTPIFSHENFQHEMEKETKQTPLRETQLPNKGSEC